MDKYANFQELKSTEQEGRDFYVVIREKPGSTTVVIAPHGGGIEPGTSEIAERIAAEDLSLALFKGIKSKHNSDLHITSTNFDEPRCLALVQSAQNVVALHGEERNRSVVYIGGADDGLGAFIRTSLETHGFQVDKHDNPGLQGTSISNICNRGIKGRGVQLELARSLRETFFHSLTAEGRQKPTEKLYEFVNAVREGLHNAGAL